MSLELLITSALLAYTNSITAPIIEAAELAAAQAAILEKQEADAVRAAIAAEVEAKVLAAKNALRDATEKLSNVASGATVEVKDVVSAGFKSLLAGWEEAKKTFGEERKSE